MQGLNRSPATIKLYTYGLKTFFNYLAEHNLADISKVTWQNIEAYQAWLIRIRRYTGSTIEVKAKCVKRLFEYLCKAGAILRNPAESVRSPRLEKPLPKSILTLREVNILLSTPDTNSNIGLRDRAILETFYSTGMRLSELCNLSLPDIKAEEGIIHIRKGKGSKDRIIPIGKVACQCIQSYLNSARPLFTKGNNAETSLFVGLAGRRIHHLIVQRGVKGYAAQAGIAKHVTPHILRHTCATHMLNNGADIFFVQQLLGHKRLDTSQRYLKVVQADLKKMLKQFHPREKHAN